MILNMKFDLKKIIKYFFKISIQPNLYQVHDCFLFWFVWDICNCTQKNEMRMNEYVHNLGELFVSIWLTSGWNVVAQIIKNLL